MEFICVIPGGGGLLSYEISKDGEELFVARLKTSPYQKAEQAIRQFTIRKINGRWEATPPHKDIVQSLIHCIEARALEEI